MKKTISITLILIAFTFLQSVHAQVTTHNQIPSETYEIRRPKPQYDMNYFGVIKGIIYDTGHVIADAYLCTPNKTVRKYFGARIQLDLREEKPLQVILQFIL
jgi:hypothetical protein